MKKHFTAQVIFAATALASQQVWALGFGRPVSDAVLGQSFTFTVPVRVQPGERFAGDCLSAKVYYGDALLPPNAVRTEVLPGATGDSLMLRVITSMPVSEPIVDVSVEVACDRHFSRRFSVFADPPTLAAGPAQVAPLPQAVAPVAGAAPVAAPPVGPATTAYGAAQRNASGAASGRPRVLRKGPTMAPANEVDTPAAARHPATDNGIAKKGPRTAPAPADTSRLLLEPGVPQLKLDMEEPVILPPSAASGAAPGLAALEDEDLRQLKALQQSLDNARRDSQSQRDQTARLQAELAQAKAQSSGDTWTPWLLALLAVAAAAIAGLVWKLRQQTRIAHSDWFNQSALGPATAVPPASELPPQVRPEASFVAADLAEPVAGEPLSDLPLVDESDARRVPIVDHSATRPLDRHSLAAAVPAGAPRELSVEELLDLEQQADFFIALGQEDAAVDLLMSHLRSAGGQSPLPYTKLLEIYRRQGDRSAYERTRARFNRRFNAYAPDWDTGPAAGRSLEDYPDTIAQLERTWHSPLDAMAILESLLFKRDDSSELFDLPAYRDVLVLYSLARDLWQHGGGQGGTHVDVLLPLDDDSAHAASVTTYPSAREVNERALPQDDLGLDLESVDVEGDTRNGMRTSFEMAGFDAGSSGTDLDLELPPSGDVHVTLDELSLSPAAPARSKPDPRDWRDGSESPDPDRPAKR
jgi:pilus assembly protein FimV